MIEEDEAAATKSNEVKNFFGPWAIAGYAVAFAVIAAISVWLIRTNWFVQSYYKESDRENEEEDDDGGDGSGVGTKSTPSVMDQVYDSLASEDKLPETPSVEKQPPAIANEVVADRDALGGEKVFFNVKVVGGSYSIPVTKVVDHDSLSHLGKSPKVTFVTPFTSIGNKPVVHEREDVLKMFLKMAVGKTSIYKDQLTDLIIAETVVFIHDAEPVKTEAPKTVPLLVVSKTLSNPEAAVASVAGAKLALKSVWMDFENESFRIHPFLFFNLCYNIDGSRLDT